MTISLRSIIDRDCHAALAMIAGGTEKTDFGEKIQSLQAC